MVITDETAVKVVLEYAGRYCRDNHIHNSMALARVREMLIEAAPKQDSKPSSDDEVYQALETLYELAMLPRLWRIVSKDSLPAFKVVRAFLDKVKADLDQFCKGCKCTVGECECGKKPTPCPMGCETGPERNRKHLCDHCGVVKACADMVETGSFGFSGMMCKVDCLPNNVKHVIVCQPLIGVHKDNCYCNEEYCNVCEDWTINCEHE